MLLHHWSRNVPAYHDLGVKVKAICYIIAGREMYLPTMTLVSRSKQSATSSLVEKCTCLPLTFVFKVKAICYFITGREMYLPTIDLCI